MTSLRITLSPDDCDRMRIASNRLYIATILGKKTAPVNQYKDLRKPFPTPDPNSTPYVPGGNQLLITDFPGFLAKWNEKMHWGYSPSR